MTNKINGFEVDLKRSDFADKIGTCVEQTIRILSNFRKMKLVQVQGRKFDKLKIDELKSLVR